MAITVYSEQQLFDLAIAFLRAKFPSAAMDEAGYFGQLARSLAQFLGSVQASISAADHDAVPGKTVDADGSPIARNTSAALDTWAWDLGLPSNRGSSVFGRNAAQTARGGAGLAVGPAATVIPLGSLLFDPTGTVTVKTDAAVTIPLSGSISVALSAVTAGALGNLPVGTVLRWQSPPPGVQPTVTLTTALHDGYDRETDLALCDRLIRFLQFPPKGGASPDWRRWAEESIDANNVSLAIVRAYVYPLRNGLGSVDVVITQAGVGAGRAPTLTKLAQVLSYLRSKKIVTDWVRVQAPSFDVTARYTVRVRIVPHPHYEYDWIGSPMTVSAYAGTNLDIVGASPPDTLKAAIDAGQQPRIQLALPAAQILPVQVRVTAYADNTPAAGFSRLTLAAALPSPAGAGDQVFPGGPAVDLLGPVVLAYNETIGPSRLSGLADPLDVWEDRVTVSGIAQAVRNYRGPDGNPVLVYAPDAGVAFGVQFSVNGGPLTGADVLLTDTSPGTAGPQCPDCRSILILRA